MTYYLRINLFPLILLTILLFNGTASSENNIEFLDKELIKELNHGIYEVVTPKLESEKIQYEKKLPFDQLDFAERNEKYYSVGTAFFINKRELMTAQHVFGLMHFSLQQNFFIRDAEGRVYPVDKVRKYSTRRDMMIFDLTRYPERIRPLHFNPQVEIGDTVFSAGNAQGEGIAYRAGQVASFTPEREYGEWKDIRFSSPASPGNSGGPLLNLRGEVVGLIIKKNQSENYNIAVPISEFDRLSDKAEFHLRNVTVEIRGAEASIVRDWSYTLPLPATVRETGEKSQAALNFFYNSISDELTEQIKEKNFPWGRRFRYYLRNQPTSQGVASILPDNNFSQWGIASYKLEKKPLSAEQNIFHGRAFLADIQAVVEKPPEIALKTFLDSPKMIMDNLLKAIPYQRYIGAEKIRITSFGEPETKTVWQDKLGRTWTSSLWYGEYNDYFVYSHCLPYPKGALCILDDEPTSFLKLGYIQNLKEGCDEITVGYEGEIDDWIEYLSLGEKYLPLSFHKMKISRDGNRLRAVLKDYSLTFTDKEINGKSSLHMHMGYSNVQMLAEELIRFELFPTKGKEAHYRVLAFFSPSPFSSDSYTALWAESSLASGDFSGKVIDRGNLRVIQKAALDTRKTVIAFDGEKIETMFIIGCAYKASSEEEEIQEDCASFFQGLEFTVK